MDVGIVAAVISGGVALGGVALTYMATKRREREAEWRRFKIEHYREYIAALSGIIEGRSTPEAHSRYADAANSLVLVAPGEVIRRLYEYLATTSNSDREAYQERHDQSLTALIQSIRRDVQPGHLRHEPQGFWLVKPPRV
jgi:hypothetical protein